MIRIGLTFLSFGFLFKPKTPCSFEFVRSFVMNFRKLVLR